MSRKLPKNQPTAAEPSSAAYPDVRNALRARLRPVFGLPFPLSDLFFRATVRRFLPWTAHAGILPLRLVNEESVTGSAAPAWYRRRHEPARQTADAARAAAELGFRYHLPAGARPLLVRMDIQYLQPENGPVVARAEWQPDESRALQLPAGRLFKGVAVVNSRNELVAKAVTEWTWTS